MARTKSGMGLSRARSRRPRLEYLEARQLLTTYTVNTPLDVDSTNTYLTLRQAIELVNGDLGPSTLTAQQQAQISGSPSDPTTIAFGITGTAPFIIQPLTSLPAITQPVTIDGTTQLQSSGSLGIEIDGSSSTLPDGTNGLTVAASGTTVKGLVIRSFTGNGIVLQGPGGDIVRDNIIGSDPSGQLDYHNTLDGVFVNSPNNTIGGIQTNYPNTIAFNQGNGIHVVSGAGNLLMRNAIYQNTGLGIKLETGTNDGIASPNLTVAYTSTSGSTATTTVKGTFVGTANTTYVLDVYSNTAAVAQGRTYVGETYVGTDATGQANFTFTLPTSVTIGQYVTATMTSGTHDTSAFSNVVQNTAPAADVSITGVRTPEPVANGGYLTYTYTVTNTSTTTPVNVTFTDNLTSLSVNLVQVLLNGAVQTQSSKNVSVSLGLMQPGAVASVVAQVVPTVTASTLPTTITNAASVAVASSELDPNTTNNTVSLTSTVQAGIDLVVTGSPSPTTAVVGQDTAFVFTVTNGKIINTNGTTALNVTATATNVVFNDALPTNLTLSSVTTTMGTVTIAPDSKSFSVAIGSMAAGVSARIALIAKPTAAGTVSNTGTATTASQPDIGAANPINQVLPLDDTATITVPAVTSLPPVPGLSTPPTVESLTRYGVHKQVTSLQIIFSQPLTASTATNLANYKLAILVGKKGPKGNQRQVPVAIASATYDPTSESVILNLKHRLNPKDLVQLTINGSTSTGVANIEKILLDGAGTGQPGSNYVRTFTGYKTVS